MYSANVAEVRLSDVITPLVIAVGVATLIYSVLRLVRLNRYKAALITTVLVLFVFSYRMMYGVLYQLNEYLGIELLMSHETALRHRYALVFIGLLPGCTTFYLLITRRDLSVPTRFCNFVSIILVVITVGSVLFSEVSLWATSSEKDQESQSKTKKTASLSPTESLPDIYYIIADRYASQATLKSAYGYDNASFYDSLRNKGFYLAQESYCNYPKSSLSIWAALNLEYHPQEVRAYDVSRSLRDGHRVGRILKENGYKYVHIGSWFSVTSASQLADENLALPSAMSEFNIAVLEMTPLPYFFRSLVRNRVDNHAAIVHYQFEQLERLSRTGGPKFVFAHLILPHGPFVFTEDGTIREKPPLSLKEGYLEQLKFTNSQLFQLVEQIIDNSRVPPIIVIQSDEGPYVREDDLELSIADRRRIRSGILNAFLIPDKKTAERLYPTISTVNTFRVVLGALGQKHDLLEDHTYAWGTESREYGNTTHYLFREVTDSLSE